MKWNLKKMIWLRIVLECKNYETNQTNNELKNEFN